MAHGSNAYQPLSPIKAVGCMITSRSGSDRSVVDDLIESKIVSAESIFCDTIH